MKKLMTIAAVALTGAVFAQGIESANIVGYNTKPLITGQQMITSSFGQVNSNQTFRISGLKITGYQNDPQWIANYGYGTSFFVLDEAGRCLNEQGRFFQYGDNLLSEDPVEWEGGVWLDYAGAIVVPGGANDTVLDAGDAFWFAGTDYTEGHQPVLQTAGSVLAQDYSYTLITGQNGVGNPMAAGVWLSDVTIEGYQADPQWVANYGYGASFFILDNAGRCLNQQGRFFQYGDNLLGEEPIEWEGGVWIDYTGATVVPHSANDLLLQPGDGVWFAGQSFTEGHQQHLVFPTAVQ